MTGKNPYKHPLELILWFVAFHSFFTGIALIVTPAPVFTFFGFGEITEKFFPVQGGVFHIVLSLAYAMAARDVIGQGRIIMLTISAKIIAAVFLFSYYVLIDRIWLVLVSGVADGLLCVIVWYLYSRFLKFRTP